MAKEADARARFYARDWFDRLKTLSSRKFKRGKSGYTDQQMYTDLSTSKSAFDQAKSIGEMTRGRLWKIADALELDSVPELLIILGDPRSESEIVAGLYKTEPLDKDEAGDSVTWTLKYERDRTTNFPEISAPDLFTATIDKLEDEEGITRYTIAPKPSAARIKDPISQEFVGILGLKEIWARLENQEDMVRVFYPPDAFESSKYPDGTICSEMGSEEGRVFRIKASDGALNDRYPIRGKAKFTFTLDVTKNFEGGSHLILEVSATPDLFFDPSGSAKWSERSPEEQKLFKDAIAAWIKKNMSFGESEVYPLRDDINVDSTSGGLFPLAQIKYAITPRKDVHNE